MKNLKGRSAVLDVHAVDSSDKEYDVEIQRMDAGAERARYFKENEKGQGAMCKMLEDMRNETELRVLKKTAIRMIKDGEMPLEKIAQYTELSLNELKEIEAEIMQLS